MGNLARIDQHYSQFCYIYQLCFRSNVTIDYYSALDHLNSNLLDISDALL